MRKIVISALLFGMMSAMGLRASDSPPILSQPDPDSPVGARNPKASEGLAQYDFLIGDWDVDIIWTPGAQKFQYKARWHNVWIVDGLVVMQEWRGPYQTGAEFRSYDAETDSWSGYNIYPTYKGWTRATARVEGDRMIVLVEGFSDDKGAYVNRETYHDISEHTFTMYSEKSYDSGETWSPGDYSMTAVRSRQ
ncbi:hypothetical protein [Hyphococcus sp.]|uniref:hypothetical protein n=1 Tax=Hyphococcus sp. TaxID=2038636 RepID=UPI0035C70C60